MGVIVIVVCTYIHKNFVIDLYTNNDDIDKNVTCVVLCICVIIIWPVIVVLEILHIISLLVPQYIKLLKDLPDINIKINKSDE
jgi:hypothetical protein